MQTRRGYVPKDERYFSPKALKTLQMASEHVGYLIDHGYGLKQASTFVGEVYAFGLDIRVLNGVDRVLYEKNCVVSSDSVVLDHCTSWVNLARNCMELTGAQAIALKG